MRFLAVTDLHYSGVECGVDGRRHSLSLGKLQEAVRLHAAGCDCIVNLGDSADAADGSRAQEALLDEVCGVLRASGLPHYTIIGNHDTSIEKPDFYPHMDMENRYYAFTCAEYRCLVLDACLNDEREPMPKQEIAWDNCRIDPPQLDWLHAELAAAELPVLIFSHVPFMLDTPDVENPHLVRNRRDAMRIFADSGKVCAVFSGHYHDGCFGVCSGIPYVTFAAMVIGAESTHAVVDVTADGITVTGYGRQKSIKIPRMN